MKHVLLLFFISFAFPASSQHLFENTKGGYKLLVPDRWTTEEDGEITDVYAPDEGEFDTWKEKLEISFTLSNGLTLEDAYTYYIKEDLPSAYKNFAIVRQGEETVHGLPTKWVLFSFSGSGTVGENEVSFTLYNLFCLTLKNNKLYMLNGIAEQSYYSNLEDDYFKIIRSFHVTQ